MSGDLLFDQELLGCVMAAPGLV